MLQLTKTIPNKENHDMLAKILADKKTMDIFEVYINTERVLNVNHSKTN
jgi:hypothetical protein